MGLPTFGLSVTLRHRGAGREGIGQGSLWVVGGSGSSGLTKGRVMRSIGLQVAAAGVCASLGLAACSAPEPGVAQVDASAILPAPSLRKTDFLRRYMLMTVRDGDELPFTTSGAPPKLDAPRKVWVGVFVRTPSVWTSAPAEVHLVRQRDQFPEYVHGGCQVVNLIADADTGRTLSSWCNVDLGGSGDRPTPIPHFSAENSPFG
jgi:hypothetical protein